MTIPPQIGLYGFGGMGDMFKWYCLQSAVRGWGYLQPLKERYPHVRTMALVCSSNPHAVDLFEHNPYIDEIEFYPWPMNKAGNPLLPGQLRLAQMLKKRGYPSMNIPDMQHLGLSPQECIVHLSQSDLDEVERLTKGIGSYIVLHPFASVDERQVVDIKWYNQLINKLVQEFSCDIVVLGKSYQRSFSDFQGKVSSYHKKETIQVDNLRVFDLVDQTNVRVAINIIQNATSFIGVHSGFSCIAAAAKMPVVVLSTSANNKIAQKMMRNWWTQENNVSVISVDKQPWDKTVSQTCSYLRG